ncbi:MAG: formate--tetrahydrofolate ligase [Chitinispirillaceae bacterium]|jgi:formate--tetrahydrofolate ligase|nr:formate--tetrahydrofolate ligase [Chitinispirillaceae bacterium]
MKVTQKPGSELPPRRIQEVARELGLDVDAILPHGHYIAKIPIEELQSKKTFGNLILVTAMSPTPQGEGKTTTTIGLADGLRHIGKRSCIAIREPSLGPYFGIKGGGTGAGLSRVVPSEAVNLHFVGDMYSVEKANNLLAAMLDNHLQHGNALQIDARRIVLRRVIDLNDRALREVIVGLGGIKHGIPRKDSFSITPASEIMAILCLATDIHDLGRRLGNMVIAFTFRGEPVTPKDIDAVGAMQVLLRDAINPNIVQSMEGTPAFVHCGPFANIAQGTSSVIATKAALQLSDYVVTEAGFGTDLGAEKFFHIKCRKSGLKPSAVVIVATVKAIAYHGGNSAAGGLGNLAKHIENIRQFGLEPVVAINKFDDDKPKDLAAIITFCRKLGVEAAVSDNFARGGAGAADLANAVLRSIKINVKKKFKFLYELKEPIERKVEIIAQKMYGAEGVDFDSAARSDLGVIEKLGLGHLPVCIAKTPLSLSDNSKLRGRPKGFRITVNELRISAGAGFIVAICGNIVLMPGLPKIPAAARIKILADGSAVGLT